MLGCRFDGNKRVEILEPERTEIEHQAGVLALPVVNPAVVHHGIVVRTHEIIAVHFRDAHLEHVEASAIADRLISGNVYSREFLAIGLEVRHVLLGDVEVLFPVLFSEIKAQAVRAIDHRNAFGDPIGPVLHFCPRVIFGGIQRLRQAVYLHILEYSGLALISDGYTVRHSLEAEPLEDRILPEINCFEHWNQSYSAAPAEQAVILVTYGSEG